MGFLRLISTLDSSQAVSGSHLANTVFATITVTPQENAKRVQVEKFVTNVNFRFCRSSIVFFCVYFDPNTKILTGIIYSLGPKCVTGPVSLVVCFVSSGFDRELEKTWQQGG